MNNLFSKSHETYEKLIQLLETSLAEQRHQRIDLATIKRQEDKIINLLKLQKQVDDYFENKDAEEMFEPGESSIRPELEDK